MVIMTDHTRTRTVAAVGALLLSLCTVSAPAASAVPATAPATSASVSSAEQVATPAGWGAGVRDQICKHLGLYCDFGR